MSTNDRYLENKSIEEAAFKLIDVCNKCPFEKLSAKYLRDTYSSPGWAEYLKRPLTIDDIPMQSCSKDEMKAMYDETGRVPWEDSIKNFVFDTTSVNTSKRFSTCILLSEFNYNYQDATIHILAGKYGLDNVTLIDVMPQDLHSNGSVDEFLLRVRHKDIYYESTVSSKALISDLLQWYVPNSTLVFCHDNSIIEYQQVLCRMPESTWSVSSTSANYITNRDTTQKCQYVCPVFSFPGSMETRAVSTGPIVFTNSKPPVRYRGKLDYYSRSVRLSKHSSGKCYDCHKLLSTVRNVYRSPLSTPVSATFSKFNTSFTMPLSKMSTNVLLNSPSSSQQ